MKTIDKEILQQVAENLAGELELVEAVRRRWHKKIEPEDRAPHSEIERDALDGISADLESSVIELVDLLREKK